MGLVRKSGSLCGNPLGTGIDGFLCVPGSSRGQALETINKFYKDSMNLELVVYQSVLNFRIHTLMI